MEGVGLGKRASSSHLYPVTIPHTEILFFHTNRKWLIEKVSCIVTQQVKQLSRPTCSYPHPNGNIYKLENQLGTNWTPFCTNTGQHPPAEICCPRNLVAVTEATGTSENVFPLKSTKICNNKASKPIPKLKESEHRVFHVQNCSEREYFFINTILNFTNCNKE